MPYSSLFQVMQADFGQGTQSIQKFKQTRVTLSGIHILQELSLWLPVY